MAYGELKVDSITFTDGGTDTTVSVSGLVQNPTFSGDITVIGTISGSVVQGGTTVSGSTVTGAAGEFGTVTGNTAGFTTVTGTTVTGNLAQFTTLTGGTAGFTTVTGTTVTGTTASFTSGVFTNISGGTHAITSGVFDDGTAAAPSITFAGDLDTGIYSPGSNQVALATSGTGRLFVNASGNVGLGTSAPSTLLNLSASNDGGVNNAIRFSDTDTAVAEDQVCGRIEFATADLTYTGVNSQIESIYGGSQGGGELQFRTGFAGALVDSLRIDQSGNVGIGTTSPGVALHVDGDIRCDGVYGETDTNTSIQFPGSDVITFNEGGNEAARIDNEGRLLVGTSSTSADTLCLIEGRSAAAAGDGVLFLARGSEPGTDGNPLGTLNFSDDGHVAAATIQAIRDGATYTSGSDQPSALTFSTTADGTSSLTERVRIDSDGRLLVGTSSGSGNPFLKVQGTVANSNAGAIFTLARGNTPPTAGAPLGEISFRQGTDEYIGASILAESDLSWTDGSSYPTRFIFSTTENGNTSPTERIRIGEDGAISTTGGATPGFSTFGTMLGRGGNLGFVESFRDGTAATNSAEFGGPVGQARIKCDGDLENTNNRYTGISDIKLKENIVDAASQWADIKNLRVRNYNFKSETGFNTHTQIGLVAQEVELVSPGLIGETLDEDTGELTKNVAYSVLYMKAVKALQEAMERIETLEAKVAALEGQ